MNQKTSPSHPGLGGQAQEHTYPGRELQLFKAARNWKGYWSSKVRPHIQGDVLEVGAGLGSNIPYMYHSPSQSVRTWTALEPDSSMAELLMNQVGLVQVVCGTLASLEFSLCFDTIIYIDVLEHIEDDGGELLRAVGFLKESGKLIILAPAHSFLFSSFDREIGHYRRYDKASLKRIIPPSLRPLQISYLDSIGMFASLANKIFLHKSRPSSQDIRLWDSFMVPLSRIMDRLLFNSIGKSILGIWQKSPHS